MTKLEPAEKKVETDLSIFFDETAKSNNEKVQLMGGIALPTKIYTNNVFAQLHELNTEYNYHWTDYNGNSKQRNGILKLFELAGPLAPYTHLNFIRYSSSKIEAQATKIQSKQPSGNILGLSKGALVKETIYTKLPERIVYGLLRGYGHQHRITASIYIEHANEYEGLMLKEKIALQLNMHALYRGESFMVQECHYRRKGEEIGVELADLLLGIVRTIVENPNPESNKKKAQIRLILQLLKEGRLQPFLSQLRLFELKESTQLNEMNVESCLRLFTANHYTEYSAL